ncbi:hypothetical protein EPUS_01768 [Endocarpon pusillum Z07020]|uniref:RRM domain-containing protein n=1 Tax=Endocarpon pusillum (strain Z07020 / HMAS-L-300199) TaxID=1263415 RepID=U1GIA4_ENDPU|nr:uncharacterized protein EPUS_01768 [Endocarpon pusillum Z07020]ERF71853.1 hypothetical protein EPUS_01768 [Endocarpon pusillum Z07020]
MALPPPPGLKATSKPQPPSSLPPRPPPSANAPPPSFKPAVPSASHTNGAGIPRPAHNAFTAFAPRSVTSSTFRTASAAQYVAPPAPSYTTPTPYPPQHDAYPAQPQYEPQSYADSSTPQIHNPFAPPTANASGTGYTGTQLIDPEMEAQILQWQSAYVSKDDNKSSSTSGFPRREGATGANTAPLGSSSRLETASPSVAASSHSTPGNSDNTAKTVHRSGGGTTWTDSTLLEWDPAHFRLFVGNLAGEVTDESLLKAFSKYPSVQKARVVRDKRTTKSKGYGFVSFSDGDEYFAAGRDMQGKYIGSHPVLLKRSNTEVRAAPVGQGRDKHGRKGKGGAGGGSGGAGGHGKLEHGGINKKQPKTKGGLRVLG